MSKKKNSIEDLKQLGSIVFSTNRELPLGNQPEQTPSLHKSRQVLKLRREVKHRAGKPVTIVYGYLGTAAELETLAKWLKTKCGVGGSVKDNEIILQGEVAEKVRKLLSEDGYIVKGI
ncbi:MAG: translation initiation factor [Bacteroidetes bacterium]|nr:translation initiation factor [Bacteroidota bacterium]